MSQEVTPAMLEAEVSKGIDKLKALIEKANEESAAKINDKVSKETFAQIETLTKSLEEKNKQLEGYYEKLEAEMKKAEKEGRTKGNPNIFGTHLEKELKNLIGNGSLTDFYKKSGKRFEVALNSITGKAVGTMTTAASLSGTDPIPSDYLPSIVETDRRQFHIRQLFRQGTTTSNNLRLLRETVGEGSIGMQTEGSAKSQIDRDFVAVDNAVETVAGFIRISEQLLDDMSALRSFLPAFLQAEIRDKEDTQFLYGTGSSNELKGLSHADNHTNFAAFEADANAQILDLFGQAITQLRAGNVQPNGILVHPYQWFTAYNLKDSTNAYLRGLSFDAMSGMLYYMGVPLYQSNAVTAGDYFVADWANNAMIFDRMGVNVEFFREDSDNVQKNLITVRGEERLTFATLRSTRTIYGATATDIATIVNYS